ncbi:lysozyme inhibitor LprI family protein [Methylobacterium tarhaniae]|uniref:lysozyme inhibitor LprI family protein n=1 Tax=Methylobacterium tarhaniae TaxID=1187852 RepID=UPI0009FB320D|nr:lysozyme inhibitor LprI family protein [Methylobacterium tarhaniae]
MRSNYKYPTAYKSNRFVYFAVVMLIIAVNRSSFATELDVESIKISKCLEGANANLDEKRKCIGVIYNSCIEDASKSTLSGMIECQNIEYRAWDKNLNIVYNKVIKLSNPDTKIYIKKSELKWLEYINKNCEWPKYVYPTGTIQAPLVQECLRNETAYRTIFLDGVARRLLEAEN